MRYCEIIQEAEIPASSYGYWLTPEGELIPVAFQKHGKVAAQHGLKNEHGALEKGWLRIITGMMNELYVAAMTNSLSRRAASNLKRLAMSDDFDAYWFETSDQAPPPHRFKTDKRSAFIEFLGGLISREPAPALQEGRVPSSTYGYWVSPEGAVIPVLDLQMHKEVLSSLEDLHMDDAITLGWVRIISNYRNGDSRNRLEIDASFDVVTERALRRIREIASGGNFRNFLIDNESPEAMDKSRLTRLYDSSVAELIDFLKTLT